MISHEELRVLAQQVLVPVTTHKCPNDACVLARGVLRLLGDIARLEQRLAWFTAVEIQRKEQS